MKPSDCGKALRIANREHQTTKLALDESDLPSVVWRLEVFEVVTAVDVNQAELTILARVALLGEPLVEDEIVFFGVASELAPDDQGLTIVRHRARNRAEPVGAGLVGPKASLELQPLVEIALKLGGKGLRRGDMMNGEAEKPIERLD